MAVATRIFLAARAVTGDSDRAHTSETTLFSRFSTIDHLKHALSSCREDTYLVGHRAIPYALARGLGLRRDKVPSL